MSTVDRSNENDLVTIQLTRGEAAEIQFMLACHGLDQWKAVAKAPRGTTAGFQAKEAAARAKAYANKLRAVLGVAPLD